MHFMSRGGRVDVPLRNIGATMKLTPNGLSVSERTCSSRSASVAAVSPGRAVPSIPSAPASDTAAANSGGAAAPMPACWIGTAQPTSCVNLVAIIVASRVVDLVALTVARMRRRGYLVRRSLLSWVKQPGRRLRWHKARHRRTTFPYFASKRLVHRIAALRSASGHKRTFVRTSRACWTRRLPFREGRQPPLATWPFFWLFSVRTADPSE